MCFLELLFNFFCIFIFIQFLLNAGGGDGKLIIKGPRPYMFQRILNTFAFGYFFGGKKLIIFTDRGYPPPSRKIPRK